MVEPPSNVHLKIFRVVSFIVPPPVHRLGRLCPSGTQAQRVFRNRGPQIRKTSNYYHSFDIVRQEVSIELRFGFVFGKKLKKKNLNHRKGS